MPFGPWKTYTRTKRALGVGGAAMTAGGITLGAGVFRASLHTQAASANILRVSNGGISTYASIGGGECSTRGNYTHGGYAFGPASWTVGTSTRAMKFTFNTPWLQISFRGSQVQNIKYGVIRTSSGPGAGKVVCFATLFPTPYTTSDKIMVGTYEPESSLFKFGL
jgi:hypothetical protein